MRWFGTKQSDQGRGDVRFLHRRWQVVLFALAASIFSLAAYWYQQRYHPPFLESLDQRSRDVVFRLRQPPKPPEEVVVIAIDELAVKDYGRWPWPRDVQAAIISELKQQGAGTVALDIVFAQPLRDAVENARQDEALITALQMPGAPVVGGYFFRPHKSSLSDAASIDQLHDNRVKIKRISEGGHLNDIPKYEFAETNQAHIAEHMAGLGAFNRETDTDGLVRRAPLLLRHQQEVFPSLALQALSVYTGMTTGVVAATEGVTEVRLSNISIPVDEKAQLTANFYHLGGQDHGLSMYSAAELLRGTLGPDELAGRLVFVGVTETGIADLIPTPVNPLMPGVLMHATIAANILQAEYLYSNWDTVLIDIALIALIPLLGVLLMALFKNFRQMLMISLLFILALGSLFYWLVAHKNQLVSLLYPSAAMVSAFAAFGIYYILTSQRTTKFLTGAFASYVSADVVDQVLSQPGQLGLSGEQREVTILFSDIRRFTTIAEQLEPQRLVELLNHYFGSMTDIVMQHKGMLDKYIGDALMAIFNAPVNLVNHQQQAAFAALQMQKRLQAMQPELEAEFGIDLRFGIGIHCGEVVVGNLGSTQRFNYTAVGDAVNITSRMESATKLYGVEIIISDAIRKHLDDSFVVRPLDKIQLKGKSVPLRIYELSQSTPDKIELANQFEQMFEAYLEGDFKAAKQRLLDLPVMYQEDPPVQFYLQRLNQLIMHPPAGVWDGVYHALQK